jgi:hypothetical protein
MNAHEGRELPIRSGSPSRSPGAASADGGATPPRSSHAWTLTDFRRWWTSPARHRWLRALALAPPRDLTNFGDLV